MTLVPRYAFQASGISSGVCGTPPQSGTTRIAHTRPTVTRPSAPRADAIWRGLWSGFVSATFSHTVRISVPPAQVWIALQQADTWMNIGPIEEVWEATHAEDGSLTGYRWSAHAAGRTWRGRATTTQSERDQRIRLALDSPEIRGAISVEIGASEITVSIDVVPNGPLARMFWGVVRGALERGLPHQVEAFAAAL